MVWIFIRNAINHLVAVMTEHDQKLFSAYQLSTQGATEMRLHDFLNALDDLRTLSGRKDGRACLLASRLKLKNAMRSMLDLWDDLEFAEDNAQVIHLSQLRELRG